MISKIILSLFSVILLLQASQAYGDEELLPIITMNYTSGNVIDLDESPQMIRAEIQIQNYNPQHGYHYMEITGVSDEEIVKNTEIFPKAIAGAAVDDLFGVQILHYIEPDVDEETLLGEYILRIYSEYGSAENASTFSIIKSSIPVTVTPNEVDESITSDEYYDDLEDQLETFCDMTDEERLDFFDENPDVDEFNEEIISICEMEDESDREDARDDSIDTIISELRDNSEDLVEDSIEDTIEDTIESEKIPSWVHDIFVWYADETISEDELLDTIEYLISEGTITLNSN